MSKVRYPTRPASTERLVRLCKTWDFSTDDLDEVDQRRGPEGEREPCASRAGRRVNTTLQAWRDDHGPDDDPLQDESVALFRVSDVAVLLYECKRLWALEAKVLRALGPPAKRMRYNRKLDKYIVEDDD